LTRDAATGRYDPPMRPPCGGPRLAAARDVLLAVLVAWFQIRGTQLVGPPAQLPRLADHAGLGYAILATGGLVFAGRRRWPTAVLVLVAAGNAGYHLARYPDGPSWVALFVALFTVTAAGDGHRAWRP
jgi:hypothetical protein